MAKQNSRGATPAAGIGAVRAVNAPNAVTFEGAPAYTRQSKGELFLLSVTNLVGEETFYESARDRDDRFVGLIRSVTLEDPSWVASLARWLRHEGNMRTASVVIAAEFVKTRLDAGVSDDIANRSVVDSVLVRPDEPGELIAYWTSKYGRTVPKPIKRGVADAVRRLYNERNFIKYDSSETAFRFGDVIELVHPEPIAPWQGDLFRYAIDKRHKREWARLTDSLPILKANLEFWARTDRSLGDLTADDIAAAGVTWESLSSWVGGGLTAEFWEKMIPNMGYMALIRNLRNFDQSGVSDDVANEVIRKITDPDEVARSRQFPFRFYSAYKNAPSLRWSYPLEQALNLATRNIPVLDGRTLVLLDSSGSMQSTVSAKSSLQHYEVGAVFAATLAARGNSVDLVSYADRWEDVPIPDGGSVLPVVKRFNERIGRVGYGTQTIEAIKANYRGHRRVIVITDGQAFPSYGGYWSPSVSETVDSTVPDNVPLYGFSTVSYRTTSQPSGKPNRYEFAGLTDQAFKVIPLLEAGRNEAWPWEV